MNSLPLLQPCRKLSKLWNCSKTDRKLRRIKTFLAFSIDLNSWADLKISPTWLLQLLLPALPPCQKCVMQNYLVIHKYLAGPIILSNRLSTWLNFTKRPSTWLARSSCPASSASAQTTASESNWRASWSCKDLLDLKLPCNNLSPHLELKLNSDVKEPLSSWKKFIVPARFRLSQKPRLGQVL